MQPMNTLADKKATTEFCEEVIQRLRSCLPDGAENVQLHAPSFEGNEWKYVKECLDTGWVSSVGKYVDQFEKNLADYIGSKFCVAAVNGTAALHIALMIAGVKPGDEVIVPDLTFIATANAVTYANAIPHLAEATERTLGLDPQKLADWLAEIADVKADATINRKTGRRIAAIVVMHTFGHPSEIDELLEVSNRFNIPLVEDAAESIGSYYKGTHTGRFGKLATLSFNGNKTITTGGGGAILTDDADLARVAKHITTTAKVPHQWRFKHDRTGYNYRLPNINAALGCAQLEMLDTFITRKRALAERYQKVFADLKDVTFFEEPANCKSNYWLNTLILKETSGALLEKLLAATNSQGIQTRPAWELMHTLPMFAECPKMPTPIAERLSVSVLCIPSSPTL